MNRISLTDLAKNEPLQPLLEKEVQVRAYELRTTRKGTRLCSSGLAKGGDRSLGSISQSPPLVRFVPAAFPIFPVQEHMPGAETIPSWLEEKQQVKPIKV